eukprot:TRINITY_DN20403_c0_g1_i7.p1 TRINITY_DN20403_c0_g1~~TRINITY_DN20403_c0_g1_i7.p1  ORF type:complete len:665 (-),score=127.29 TRINITY_DN20403_c0_g1_i7:642-2636(-)
MEVPEVGEELVSIASSVSTVAVAVNGKRNCKAALKWALERFGPEGRHFFKLLHVRPKITMVPTEMGNYLPISNVRDDVASAYKKEIEWRTNAVLLPYKKMCSQKKVEAEAVVIEADDVPGAISLEIAKFSISTLVIGASSRSLLARKFRGHDVSSRISGCIPSFCTVYIISKGRLSSVRTSTSDTDERTLDGRSDSNVSIKSSSSSTSSPQTEWTDTGSVSNHSFYRSSSLPDQRYQALLTINEAIVNKRPSPLDTHHLRSLSLNTEEDARGSSSNCSGIKDGVSIACTSRSYQTDNKSWISDQVSMSDILTDLSLSGQVDVDFELEKLRIELRHAQGMYEMAQNETNDASQHLEILSTIRHPHLLLLLGACLDHGCLVYEYMENGSLDDRLFRKNNTPPIPWFVRYRIAWEIASALVFLHNAEPKPIVHRDLKPANILLDRNFVSKIGDVGISTLLPTASSSMSTMAKDTAPAGTFCYIDPEYQRTGKVSPKSDVYAFGMVILQLLTTKPPLALTETVETALEEGRLVDILDSKAGKWPIEETQELAALGLSCAELRRRDRPDLKDKVLPMLERLKEIAARAQELVPVVPSVPPNHFICPILQDVMEDPCVAADGYTYERRAIDQCLRMNDKSPVTNAPFPHKNLIPNFNLLSAIMEWKSKHQ